MKYSFGKYKVVGRKKVERRKKEDRFKVRRRNVQSTPKEHPRYREAIRKWSVSKVYVQAAGGSFGAAKIGTLRK